MLYSKNEYIENLETIVIPSSKSLDDVIKVLQEYKNNNKDIVIEYKGNYLTPLDLEDDIDYLYKTFYGLSKEEYQKWRLIKRGLDLIYPDKDELWKEYVSDGLHSEQRILSLLEIMEAIENNPTFDQAFELFKLHSNEQGIIYGIQVFSKKGPDFLLELFDKHKSYIPENFVKKESEIRELFVEQKAKNKRLEQKHTTRSATTVVIRPDRNIEYIFSEIRKAQNREEQIIVEYNGISIPSNMISSLDDLYRCLYGKTKESLNDEKERKEAIAYIPYLINTSIRKGLIRQDKIEEWKECVKKYSYGDSYGMEVRLALKYMDIANNNTEIYFDNIQNYSEDIVQNMKNILIEFSVKGRDFWEKEFLKIDEIRKSWKL